MQSNILYTTLITLELVIKCDHYSGNKTDSSSGNKITYSVIHPEGRQEQVRRLGPVS